MIAEITNTEQMNIVASLFNRLAIINAELEAIEKICTNVQEKEFAAVMCLELRKKVAEKPPINLNGEEDGIQSVILVQPHPMAGGFPPNFQNMISEQVQRQKQYEVDRYDYALSDVITIRVMAVIATELKQERERIFAELKNFNIVINGV